MLEVLKKNRKTGSFEYKCGGVLSELNERCAMLQF